MIKMCVSLSGERFQALLVCVCIMIFAAGKMNAQDVKIHWGVAAPVALKFQLLPTGGSPYDVWGNIVFCVVHSIEGADENSLSILNKTGFSIDFTSYTTPDQDALVMERASLFLNPEIVFPTNKKRMKITAGFGVEWNGYFLAQSETGGYNNIADEMNKNRRKIFPFVTAGLLYNLKNDFYLQVFVRQMMTGYFTKEARIFLESSSVEPDMILNDKPTFAGIGISYFFK